MVHCLPYCARNTPACIFTTLWLQFVAPLLPCAYIVVKSNFAKYNARSFVWYMLSICDNNTCGHFVIASTSFANALQLFIGWNAACKLCTVGHQSLNALISLLCRFDRVIRLYCCGCFCHDVAQDFIVPLLLRKSVVVLYVVISIVLRC